MMENGWESQLNTSVLEQSRQKILQVLNAGSLKELKGLQQIGDKKAKLILGWREIHGHFTKVGRENVKFISCFIIQLTLQKYLVFGVFLTSVCDGCRLSFSHGDFVYVFVILQLEDLVRVEGMTEKRFSSFMKVSLE